MKTYFYLILFTALTIPKVLYGQSARMDSLQVVLKTASTTDSLLLLEELGNAYIDVDKYDEALNTSFSFLKLSSRLNDSVKIGDAYNKIGNVYYHLGDYRHALNYYKKTLSIFDDIGTNDDKSGIYNNLALICYEIDSLDEALNYYTRALEILKVKGNESYMAIIYHNLALVYNTKKEFPKAIENQQKALIIFRKLNEEKHIANTYNNIGRTYYHQGQYEQSHLYFDSAQHLAVRIKSPYILMDNYHYRTRAYAKENDYKNAYYYGQMFVTLKDSLFNIEKEKQLTEIEARYKGEKQKAENIYLKKENEANEKIIKNQNIAVLSVIAVAILLFILLALLFYSNLQKKNANIQLTRQKQEIEQKNIALEKANKEISTQKEKLESINNIKDKLFSIISHEFRSPLNSLKGALSLVQHGAITHDELVDLSKDITDKINNTSIFLDNLLNWARSQMQGIDVKKRLFSLHKLVKSNFDLLGSQAKKKKLDLINNIPEDFVIEADEDMVHLVIRNLISNAIKFSLDNGIIEITVKEKDAITEISVKDNGVGIPEANLKHLFALDSITTVGTANEKGTGLGLMISKNFISAHGGTIWLDSKENQGSTFTFTIPH